MSQRFISLFNFLVLFPPCFCTTSQEPVNVGFIFSLPWDIANTLRAPLAGPLSIVLAGSLALICFAGLAFAPLWYVFGFPKRKYRTHTIPDKGRSFSTSNVPTFSEGLENFLPNLEEDCGNLLLCHAHGFLPDLPQRIPMMYSYFSRKLRNMKPTQQDSIKLGLRDQTACSKRFANCELDIRDLLKAIFEHNEISNKLLILWRIISGKVQELLQEWSE